MYRRLIGKRASLSHWLIQVIFNRSLYIIRFPLIYYAYIQNQPQYQGSEHAEPCVLRHCLRTSPSYVFSCLHKGNMVFWISILYESNRYSRISFFCLSIVEAALSIIVGVCCFQSMISVSYWGAFKSLQSWSIVNYLILNPDS